MKNEKRLEAEFTNVRLSFATRNRLADAGVKDDSFDDIINKLLDVYDKVRKK